MSRSLRYDYSPITAPGPACWPNGARLALYVAVGVEEYDFGRGLTEDILPGAPQPDLVNTAWRDYGNRVGGFRLIERLVAEGIRPTILLNADVYDTAPDLILAARRAGAEFVAHGRSNSDTLAGMDPETEHRYLADVAARIAAEEGTPPGGWSSPWLAHTRTTPENLVATGYRYLLDLRLDDRPVWLKTAAGPLLSIPYAAELNDSTTMIGRNCSAQDFATMLVDEGDELLAAAETRPLVMSVVLHSFISGQPFRLRALSRALAHLARQPGIWLTTPGEIAEAFAGQRQAETQSVKRYEDAFATAPGPSGQDAALPGSAPEITAERE